jgi:hypothetical protein
MTLTPKQRRLRKEIDEIASSISMDHWAIEGYEPDVRSFRLRIMMDKLVRGEVIFKYTLVDEYLTCVICDYYFHRPDKSVSYQKLWKTKRFRVFVHYIMDELFLLKKLDIVHAIRAVPKDVRSAITRINDARNALAHSFFPQNRRRYMAAKRVLYEGLNLFTKDGMNRFQADFDVVTQYFDKYVLGSADITLE